MKLSQLGEFRLIDKLSKMMPTDNSVKVGIGDDAAVVEINAGKYGLLTTDMLVEGVHFMKSDDPVLIGEKAISASLSDIGAMGGVPKYALVSLGVSPTERVERIRALYRGMITRARDFKTAIVGGDTVTSERLIVNICIFGEVPKKRYFCRNGAQIGDGIYVSGSLGNSYKSRHHLTFKPRLKESAYLAKNFTVTSMIDISDGLAADLGHIIKSSRVGARIYEERIPLCKGAGTINALYDGEDFELLFTVPGAQEKKLLQNKIFRFYKLGEIIKGDSIELIKKKNTVSVDPDKGYRHF